MSKTIKIIDLLNKIVNGEEVPKKIRFHGLDFEFDELEGCYIHNDNDLAMMMDGLKYSQLIDIAEIIEEQEEIDIQGIRELDKNKETNIWAKMNDCEDKISELVQAVKQLDRQIKDKE